MHRTRRLAFAGLLSTVRLFVPCAWSTAFAFQDPYIATVVSGANQTKVREGSEPFGGTAHFDPIVVRITDRSGRPVANHRVGVGCRGETNAMACDTSLTDRNTTDGNGQITIHGLRAYYATGQLTLHISGEDIVGLSIIEHVADPAPEKVTWVQGAKLAVVAGGNQMQPLRGSSPPGGAADFEAMSVKLTGPDGKPVANAPVVFHCNGGRGACQFTPSGAENGTMSVHTNGDGVATLAAMSGKSLRFYYATGAFSVTVSYGPIASVTIPFTVASGPTQFSYSARVLSGGNQTAIREGTEVFGGIAHFAPITVQLIDSNGNPASNVRFGVTCRGETTAMACDTSQIDLNTTDRNGQITIHGLRAYYATGWLDIIIEGDDLKQLIIPEHVVDPAPEKVTWVQGAKLTVVAGNNQALPRHGSEVPGGIAKFEAMSVKLTGPDGKPVAHAPVVFHCNITRGACQFTPSGAEKGTMTVHTNGDGIATLAAMFGKSLWFCYAWGDFSMTVSYGSIASVAIPFTVTQ